MLSHKARHELKAEKLLKGSLVSYGWRRKYFSVSKLDFEVIADAGYIRVLNEVRDFPLVRGNTLKEFFSHKDSAPAANKKSLSALVESAAILQPLSTTTRLGWISIALEPTLLCFFENKEDSGKVDIRFLSITSARDEILKLARLQTLRSFTIKNGAASPIVNNDASTCYASASLPNKLDILEEYLYTEDSTDVFYLQKLGIYEASMYDDEDKQSGKALYNTVRELMHFDSVDGDYETPVRMIEDGHNVNYWDPVHKTSTLHVAASIALRDTLLAIMQCSDVNYLRRDGNGMFPADLAFRVSDEFGAMLSEKQVEQARKDRSASNPDSELIP